MSRSLIRAVQLASDVSGLVTLYGSGVFAPYSSGAVTSVNSLGGLVVIGTLGSSSLIQSGNTLLISGREYPDFSGVRSVNALTGLINLVPTGTVNITVSGNSLLIGGGVGSGTSVSISGGNYLTNTTFYGIGGIGIIQSGNNVLFSGTVSSGGSGGSGSSLVLTGSQVLGGSGNTIVGDNSTIAGGVTNRVSGNCAFIGGGLNHLVSGGYSNVVAGGNCNQIALSFNTIIGGGENSYSVGSLDSFIGGGAANTLVSTNYSTIVGGAVNYISGNSYEFIGGGVCNCVLNSCNSIIVGGCCNKIQGRLDSYIGGGSYNTICSGGDSVIVGGSSNLITRQSGSSIYYNFIGGGQNNEIICPVCTITCNNSILGGGHNTIAGQSNSILGGSDNAISGNGSGCFATAMGHCSHAYLEKQVTFGGGSPTTGNQLSFLQWYNITTNGDALPLYLGGRTGNFAYLQPSRIWHGHLDYVGSATDFSQIVAGRKAFAIIKSGSSVSFIDTVKDIYTPFNKGSAPYGISLLADNVSGLCLIVTGAIGQNVQWKASAYYQELPIGLETL